MVHSLRTTMVAAILAFVCGGSPLCAQLPTFSGGDRLGYFATYKDRNIEFGINTASKVRLMPTLSEGLTATFLGGSHTVDIAPQITTVSKDGKATVRRIVETSLTTEDEVTDKFEKATIRGEVTGGAKFEFTLQQNRGALVMGGKLLDSAASETSSQFAIAIKFPAQLTKNKLEKLTELTEAAKDDRAARRELRDFLRDYRADRLTVRRTDGSETRYQLTDPVEGGAAAITGPGISELELQSGLYDARRIVITAETGSSVAIETVRENELQPGFSLIWSRDPSKDPEGKARMAIAVR